jgi:hypothetical protein
MRASSRIDAPSLDSEQLKDLLVAVADVIITIDDDYVITGVTDPMNIDNLTLWKWIGRKVVDVVSPESAPKLLEILRREGPGAPANDRWRHVNFLDARGGGVPLLIKYFHVPAGPATTRLIIGRDLRPMENAQKRFQAALADMAGRPAERPAGSFDASIALRELIGSKPFDEIVTEAMEILQHAFFTEALSRCNGDASAAARLLGLELPDFLRRLRNEGTA